VTERREGKVREYGSSLIKGGDFGVGEFDLKIGRGNSALEKSAGGAELGLA